MVAKLSRIDKAKPLKLHPNDSSLIATALSASQNYMRSERRKKYLLLKSSRRAGLFAVFSVVSPEQRLVVSID